MVDAKEFVRTVRDSKVSREALIGEILSRAFQLRAAGQLEKAAEVWQEAQEIAPEYMQQRGGYGEGWVHLFVKLGLKKRALEIYKMGYVGAMPNPDSLTSEERVMWGERLIFGLTGGSEIAGAIGKAQCPLCHGFGPVRPGQRVRAPQLFGLPKRIKSLLLTKEYTKRGYTVQPYAFEGSGTANNLVEYLAESKVCPSCYVVPGFGVKGSKDLESPEPKIHKAPISLSIDEMILVDTWILKHEEMEIPTVSSMRAVYHKFIQRPQERSQSFSPQSIFLAHLYDLNGKSELALKLLKQNYHRLLRHEKESVLSNRHLIKWRENPEMFPHLRKHPEVVKQFPKLLQLNEEWRATDVPVDNLGFEYVSYAFHTYSEYPRWFPDSQRLLYTVCPPEKTCELWRTETYNAWSERVLTDASFGDPSPDGTKLVFIREKNIYLHDLHTKQSVQLTEVLPHALTPPVWNHTGDALEVISANSPSSPCQKSTFNLKTKSWTSRFSNPWELTWKRQGLPEHRTFDFVGLTDFQGKCQAKFPARVTAHTAEWKRWYDHRWNGKSSFARLLVTPALHWRERSNPLWLVDQQERGALKTPYSAVTPVLSPNGRYLAYEFRNKDKDPTRGGVGIVVAMLGKRETPLPKFIVNLGERDGLKPGTSLLVYYGNPSDPPEEKGSFEEDMAIGGVRVLDVHEREAVVQQSLFKVGVFRTEQGSSGNLVLAGDLAVTADLKKWAPLKRHE